MPTFARLSSRLQPVKSAARRRLTRYSGESVVFSRGAIALRASKARFRARSRPTDAFLVGHPKSGNTWLAYMLAVVKESGDPNQRVNVANVGDFVPAAHQCEELHVLWSRAILRSYDRLSDPRVFRNELPVCPDLYPRTVYLVRDPRAVLVSYHHHYRAEFADHATPLDEFVTTYLANPSAVGAAIDRWDRQVTEWTGRASTQPVLIVRYEDLHREPEETLDRITAFCGIPASPQTLSAAAKRGEFEAMRTEEDRHGAESEGFRMKSRRGRFYRRGETDAWAHELPPEVRRTIEAEFGSVMTQLGYVAGSPGPSAPATNRASSR